MMNAIQFIESNFLGDKHLTKNTANMIRALAKSYSDEAIIYFLDTQDHMLYLKNKEYDNQAHFESTVLLLLKRNAPYLSRAYKTHVKEMQYEERTEPPELPPHETSKKEVKHWIIQ